MSDIRRTITTTREQRVAWRARFDQHVQRSDGCWLWLGTVTKGGYGRFNTRSFSMAAHRVAWEMEHDQSVPEGLDVMHSCDNPPCVNPAHLSAGTRSENLRDCVAKGRNVSRPPCGEKHQDHVLTSDDVRSIRVERAAGAPLRVLAAKYGVSDVLISKVARRRVWRHVE